MIVTRDPLIRHLNGLTVAPITRTIRGLDVRVGLGYEDGLSEPSEAALDQLQTVPKRHIGNWIATLSDDRMREINRAIAFALGFDRYEQSTPAT